MGSGAFLVESCRQLADALIEAWDAHGGRPEMPQDEDEVVFARRLVAQRCIYGVDRNPVAVDLAKVSLWLVTLARDHALTFVDHALRHGDSLVGLSRRQVESFRWDCGAAGFEAVRVRDHLDNVIGLRRRVRSAGDSVSDAQLHEWWHQAQDELDLVRLCGDLVLAAYFSCDSSRNRETKRAAFADAVQKGLAHEYRAWLEEWRDADVPLVPFHWELEFPEVFERTNPGFDAIVGNPPFMKGGAISSNLGDPYLAYLLEEFEASHGNSDLVAFFFRRAFGMLRDGGCMGLIATKTIAQGDTRATGI